MGGGVGAWCLCPRGLGETHARRGNLCRVEAFADASACGQGS